MLDPGGTMDEIALKARYWTSECVNARLAEEFVGSERISAAIALSALVGEDPADPEGSDEASCRLMLAAMKVSEGDLGKLAMWIEVAVNDPRDLMAAAEYRRELHGGSDEDRAADLAEYLVWVSGGIPTDGGRLS